MKKRIAPILMILVLVGGLLAGCGDGGGTATSSSGGDGLSTDITWLHHFQESGIQSWVNEMLGVFAEEQPGVQVNVEVVTADVFDQTLKTKIASDDAPMIFDLNNKSYYTEYGNAGHLYDLTGLEGLDNIDEAMLPAGQVDGKQWGVPLDVNGYGVFYNKGLFDQYGLEVPQTLSELRQVCETFQSNGVQPFAAPMSEQWCLQIYYDVVGNAFYEDTGWFENKMNLASNFTDDEAFRRSVEIYFSFKPYWGGDPFGTNWDTAQNLLANGEAAMLINGSWTIDGVTAKNPDCEVRFFAMPTTEDPGGAILTMTPGSGLCLYNSPDSAKLEAGKVFLNCLFTKESGEYYARNAFKMSTAKGVDLSFSEALMDIQSYPESQTWNNANITRFTAEYEQIFYETLVNYSMDSDMDLVGLASSLDSDFASIAQ